MSAVTLNRILAGLIVIMTAGLLAGFYFASQFLAATALETDYIRTDVAMSQDNVRKLQQLETQLALKRDSVSRARNLVGSMEGFDYQNRVVEDLTRYASLAGDNVKITNFTFTDPTKKAAAAATKKPIVTIPGVRVLDATVTLNSPVDYLSFMRFLRAIEQNLTKMQVTGVDISPDSDDPRQISGPAINLQIYVREQKP